MSHMPATILIVDDEKNTREGLSIAIEEEYEVYMASGADEAFNLMEAETFDIVLTDLRMAGKSGLKVIDRAITLPNRPICIMMTAYGDIDNAVETIKAGAFDYLLKPFSAESKGSKFIGDLIEECLGLRVSNRLHVVISIELLHVMAAVWCFKHLTFSS